MGRRSPPLSSTTAVSVLQAPPGDTLPRVPTSGQARSHLQRGDGVSGAGRLERGGRRRGGVERLWKPSSEIERGSMSVMEESYLHRAAGALDCRLVNDLPEVGSVAHRQWDQKDVCFGDCSLESAYAVALKSSSVPGPGVRLLSHEEVLQHRDQKDAWIVVNGKVYDVTPFLEVHPGGAEVLLNSLQSAALKDAGPLMRGELNDGDHIHSKASFRMLDQFLVGTVEAVSRSAPRETSCSHVKKYRYNVDLTKPIVAQVGFLGADYDEWIHDPIITTESPRFFENDILEDDRTKVLTNPARAIFEGAVGGAGRFNFGSLTTDRPLPEIHFGENVEF